MPVLMLQWNAFPRLNGAISDRINTVTFINLRDGEMEFYMQRSVAMAN